MLWRCEECGYVHDQYEPACLYCRHDEVEPVPAVAVDGVSEGVDAPDALDSDEARTYGSAEGGDRPSSPDVAPDGAVVRGDNGDDDGEDTAEDGTR